ncbi:hypothetical protein SDC9_162646 [bioreactor metagenome]|uniref:Uncharacterized protein n=1 Tax=bioreactor metagenome TaxID=1076179 RepID=A0A645FNP1_9ZZZZ
MPPFVGVAVKVTDVPAQIVVADAAMLTLTGRLVVTDIDTVFDVAGLPDAHEISDVSSQVTASPLLSVLLV